jgi:hypothetical protein
MAIDDFAADRLKEVLHYDPSTGVFTWATNMGGRGKVGAVAGWSHQDGYMEIGVFGRKVRAHRLAWLFVFGRWPICQIDHINGDRADNRIENLREVTDKENRQNLRTAMVTNKTTGLLGSAPTANGKRWMAKISLHRKQIYLGTFDSPELAHQAYLDAKRRLHIACTI